VSLEVSVSKDDVSSSHCWPSLRAKCPKRCFPRCCCRSFFDERMFTISSSFRRKPDAEAPPVAVFRSFERSSLRNSMRASTRGETLRSSMIQRSSIRSRRSVNAAIEENKWSNGRGGFNSGYFSENREKPTSELSRSNYVSMCTLLSDHRAVSDQLRGSARRSYCDNYVLTIDD